VSGETIVPSFVLLPEDNLLRVLRNRAEEEDHARAFFLRNDERDSGLSVRFHCTYEKCRADFNSSYGVLALTVQSVLEIPLPVEPDAIDHANIKEVPHKDDDELRATYLARRLSEASTIVDSGKRI